MSKSELERGIDNIQKSKQFELMTDPEAATQDKHEQAKEIALISIANFNAALVNSLVSIPTTLSIMMAINYHAKDNEKIDPTLSILTLAFGFVISFVVSGGTNLFRTFTATQAFILVMNIRKFGAVCLPWTCVTVGFFLMMMVLMRGDKFVKATPHCILAGLKFATGNLLKVYIPFLTLPRHPTDCE